MQQKLNNVLRLRTRMQSSDRSSQGHLQENACWDPRVPRRLKNVLSERPQLPQGSKMLLSECSDLP